jgi:anti-sigma B factor antagonist
MIARNVGRRSWNFLAAVGVKDESLPSTRGGRKVALKITQREVDGVDVMALEGRIVLGEESNALREGVKALLAKGQKRIVLNMTNVTYIDSAGLGTLVASHHSAKAQGASLRLSNLGSKFQEVLQVTKLLTVFDVYDSEAAAVRSFTK